MTDALPAFRYHPDPVATGAVRPDSSPCGYCGLARGFAYVGPVYGASRPAGKPCPWCIADGSAAARFGVFFTDDDPLARAGIAPEIIDDVALRTPGYSAWQQESWLAHCDDACEFHGDASVEDVLHAVEATRADWRRASGLSEAHWSRIASGYQPMGNPAFYKFVCRHCALVRLGGDFT